MRIAITCVFFLSVLGPQANAAQVEYRAAVVRSGLADESAALADRLAGLLKSAGYSVEDLSFDDLCDPGRLQPGKVDLLVLPDASALPARSMSVIDAYLKGGGDIIALNAPLWRRCLYDDGGKWLDREEFQRRHSDELAQATLIDFVPGSIDQWRRSTNDDTTTTKHTVGRRKLHDTPNVLRVEIDNLTNWDTFRSPPLEQPFPEGHEITVFWATGGPQTTSLAIEWTEQDGSRWMATVQLGSDWRQYVLAPEDFRFWESVPARADTRFNPAQARELTFGLALSHTNLPGGQHDYSLARVGTAKRTALHEKLLTSFEIPVLDTLSPTYKFFDCSGVAELLASGHDSSAHLGAPIPATAIRSPHPRPNPGGFNKGRAWRWSPLIEAYTDGGEWRGAPATLTVHADGPYKGGVWAAFGIADPDWYLAEGDNSAMDIIGSVIARMRRGVFIVDAGAEFHTYFEDQDVTIGARAVNLGKERCEASARFRFGADEFAMPLPLAPGENGAVSRTLPADSVEENGSMTEVGLEADGQIVDTARHEIHVWRPRQEKSFVTSRNGEFMLDGRRWRPHGVNYMPSSGIGTEDWDYFEHWVGARAYDPVVVQRDLDHIRDMGMNSVSIFIHRESMEAQNLLDLLRRIEKLGMKANLSLRPGTPMDFRWDDMRDLIEFYRLAENDTVFAYDLAWEPMFGNHEERKQWDERWRAWIVERYGSLENAEADWGFPAQRDKHGEVTNPTGPQMVKDGEWRRMVAAYRRFLDTLLYDKYSRARRLVRGIDPNHLISFRMTLAGDPTTRGESVVPYDYAYLAGAVDILEPEAYGRIGDWDRVRPGWFTHEYARWANPELPMIWAEAGLHVWDMNKMNAPMPMQTRQAEFYELIYRLLIDSCADGIFFWWYPGGFRVNERSDYGVINPDGSDRPVTVLIRDSADRFINGPSAKPIDTWLAIDRDPHPDGIAGLYDVVEQDFWEAIAEGKTPGLKTEGTGATSANCPLIAVGNRPYTGNNPLKFLDGFFDEVLVLSSDGEWVAVENGASVRVDSGRPVMARMHVTNLGEAKWLAGSGDTTVGSVVVSVSGPEETQVPLPVDISRFANATLDGVRLAPAGIDGPTRVTLTFCATDRAKFGPRFEITLNGAGN